MFSPFPTVTTGTTHESSLSQRLLRFWSRVRLSFPWMVGVAFGVRVLCIIVMHTYKVRTTEDNFGFGWEMGRIGASIASGHGFANPFQTPTGLTAWEPPLTPYLMAGVFKVFGIYTRASAFALLTIADHSEKKSQLRQPGLGHYFLTSFIGTSSGCGRQASPRY
jgi:hypothetical protein